MIRESMWKILKIAVFAKFCPICKCARPAKYLVVVFKKASMGRHASDNCKNLTATESRICYVTCCSKGSCISSCWDADTEGHRLQGPPSSTTYVINAGTVGVGTSELGQPILLGGTQDFGFYDQQGLFTSSTIVLPIPFSGYISAISVQISTCCNEYDIYVDIVKNALIFDCYVNYGGLQVVMLNTGYFRPTNNAGDKLGMRLANNARFSPGEVNVMNGQGWISLVVLLGDSFSISATNSSELFWVFFCLLLQLYVIWHNFSSIRFLKTVSG